MSAADLLAAVNARIDLASVLWLLPLTFVFHDFEEILKAEDWLSRRGEAVLGKAPAPVRRLLRDTFRMNTRQFAGDVLWLYSAVFVVTAAAVFFDVLLPYLAALAIYFPHVFTHVGQAALLRMYTPGVATAVLIVLPYSLYAYYRLLDGGVIGWNDVWRGAALAAACLPFIIGLGLWGRRRAVNRA
jgi:hypothetical protein